MRKERRAKLTVEGWPNPERLGHGKWLRLKARNSEPLMHSEIVSNPKRARAAIIRAMVDVLTDSGYRVEKEEPND